MFLYFTGSILSIRITGYESLHRITHTGEVVVVVVACCAVCCDGVIRADTEEEAMRQAAAHAKAVHGLDEVMLEMAAKVKAALREE